MPHNRRTMMRMPPRGLQAALWLGLGVLFACCASGATPPDASAADVTWYSGRCFLWRNIFTNEEYLDLVKRLPEEQQQALAQLPRTVRSISPLDIRRGKEMPRISYILAISGDLRALAKFPQLEHLDLYSFMMWDGDLTPLASARVRCLTLPSDVVTDAQISRLFAAADSLPCLKHLDVPARRGAVTKDVLETIRRHAQQLVSLQLSEVDVSDEWIAAAAKFQGLKGLRLFRTSVTADGLRQLSQLKGLTHLSMVENPRLDARAIEALAACRDLRELHLYGKQVDDEVLRAVADHLAVERLAIGATALTAISGKHIKRMQHLRMLVIDDDTFPPFAEPWRQADPQRHGLFPKPDLDFGGWISGIDAIWAYPRELDPLYR